MVEQRAVVRVNVLGVGVSAVDLDATLAMIEGDIRSGTRGYICLTPVHSLMACWRDPDVRREFNRSRLIAPDGMPLVWLLRALGHPRAGRVYGPDLLLAACEQFQDFGFGHFFYGGASQVLDSFIQRLGARFPDLNIAGSHAPPFVSSQYDEPGDDLARINRSGADIVWVALGSPRQERWMARHRAELDAPVLIGVGAAFDFLAGAKPQAPHWVQRSGLEWLFRLATEPRRLWRRYIWYPLFPLLIAAQLSGLKRYELES